MMRHWLLIEGADKSLVANEGAMDGIAIDDGG
jgi:hypothetical protein